MTGGCSGALPAAAIRPAGRQTGAPPVRPSDARSSGRLIHLGRHVDEFGGVTRRCLEVQQDLGYARCGVCHQVLDDLGHAAPERLPVRPSNDLALYLALARTHTPIGRSLPRSAAKSCTFRHCSASVVAPVAMGNQPSARSTSRRVARGLLAAR